MIPEHDIFYNIDKKSFAERKAIIFSAKKLCYSWWVDILDCKKSFSRQKVNMPFGDIMKKFTQGCHFVVIHRRGYSDSHHGEVGFSTLKTPDYFLWVYLTEEKLSELVKNHKLIPRKF